MRMRYIPELLEVHREDLAFLWGQRREAIGSRLHTLRELSTLNERVEAHVQGLLVAPPEALVEALQPRLAEAERDEVFAAAFALLRLSRPQATALVVAAFLQATGATLAGLCDALSAAPPGPFIDEMKSALDHAPPLTAASAAVVLANHRVLTGQARRLSALLQSSKTPAHLLALKSAR